MKQKLILSLISILFLSTGIKTLAQAAEGNVFIYTTFERAFPDDGSAKELDSLNQISMDYSFKDNPYVISYKTLRHWWGNNNRDFIQIIEVKNWENIEKANEKANELFMKAMPDKAERKKFNKAFNKYFTGKHSDEIYREVKSK